MDIQDQLEVNHLKRFTDNLISNERIALHELRQCKDVGIQPADKGSAVVIIRKEDYINKTERPLGNHTHYNLLNANPTPVTHLK